MRLGPGALVVFLGLAAAFFAEPVLARPFTLLSGEKVEIVKRSASRSPAGYRVAVAELVLPLELKSTPERTRLMDDLFEEALGAPAQGEGFAAFLGIAPRPGIAEPKVAADYESWEYVRLTDGVWRRITQSDVAVGPSAFADQDEADEVKLPSGDTVLHEGTLEGFSDSLATRSLFARYRTRMPVDTREQLVIVGSLIASQVLAKTLDAHGLEVGLVFIFDRPKLARFDFRPGIVVAVDRRKRPDRDLAALNRDRRDLLPEADARAVLAAAPQLVSFGEEAGPHVVSFAGEIDAALGASGAAPRP
ncbi:MAG: hypothetical protein H6923_04350 [Alphaproteobacteria bacterium]|nr:hypothetical protein [Alphaproteobacteria bacterium]